MTNENLEELRKLYDVPPKLYASFDVWRINRIKYIKKHTKELQEELAKLTAGKTND